MNIFFWVRNGGRVIFPKNSYLSRILKFCNAMKLLSKPSIKLQVNIVVLRQSWEIKNRFLGINRWNSYRFHKTALTSRLVRTLKLMKKVHQTLFCRIFISTKWNQSKEALLSTIYLGLRTFSLINRYSSNIGILWKNR